MTARGPDPTDLGFHEELRVLAVSAARVGGELARASFGQIQSVRLKADRSEVTEVDVAAERAIIEHIRDQRPEDAFVGEEGVGERHEVTEAQRHEGTEARRHGGEGSHGATEPRSHEGQSVYWIIDPIDGTRNYVRGVLPFVCSVAAMCADRPIAGAVFDPIRGVMYSAALGGGLRIDGGRAAPATSGLQAPADREAMLFVGIPSARRAATQHLVYHAIESHIVRNLGTAALHLALAASGVLDVVVMGNGKLWDIAAGALLITEAGGLVTAPDGSLFFPLDVSRYADEELPLIAGNPAAHARLLREVRQDD